MSREKSGDFAKNRPELSAIKSVDCVDVDGRHGICRNFAETTRTKCVTIADDSRTCTIWNRARAVLIMTQRSFQFRGSNATCPDPKYP